MPPTPCWPVSFARKALLGEPLLDGRARIREAAQFAGGGRDHLSRCGGVQQSCKHACRPGASSPEPINATFAFLVAGVVATTDAEEACKGVDVAVMVGGFPRKVRFISLIAQYLAFRMAQLLAATMPDMWRSWWRLPRKVRGSEHAAVLLARFF